MINVITAIVRIVASFPDGTRLAGSGGVIGSNNVLTSEHVLVHSGVPASQVDVYALDGTYLVTAITSSIRVNVPVSEFSLEGITNVEALSSQDYATISLHFPLGLKTGWLTLDSSFVSGQVTISGYPGNGTRGQSFEQVTGFYTDSSENPGASVVENVTPATLRGGFSGSAVTNKGGQLVGVVSAANPDYAILTDISAQTAAKIIEWVTSDDGLVQVAVNRANVTNVFKVGLGREPNAGELNYWAGQLGAGLTLESAYELAVTVPAMQVSLLFDTMFNKLPSFSELNDLVGRMSGGMSLHEVEAALLGGSAFLATPGAQSVGAFVDQLSVNILGYSISGPERDYWVNKAEQDGWLSVLDEVSSPEVEVLHLGIIGSVNPLAVGVQVWP